MSMVQPTGQPSTDAVTGVFHMFINEVPAWLFLSGAQVVAQAFTSFLFRRNRKRSPRRAKVMRPAAGRHVAPRQPYRGEIAPTMRLPVVQTSTRHTVFVR